MWQWNTDCPAEHKWYSPDVDLCDVSSVKAIVHFPIFDVSKTGILLLCSIFNVYQIQQFIVLTAASFTSISQYSLSIYVNSMISDHLVVGFLLR